MGILTFLVQTGHKQASVLARSSLLYVEVKLEVTKSGMMFAFC